MTDPTGSAVAPKEVCARGGAEGLKVTVRSSRPSFAPQLAHTSDPDAFSCWQLRQRANGSSSLVCTVLITVAGIRTQSKQARAVLGLRNARPGRTNLTKQYDFRTLLRLYSSDTPRRKLLVEIARRACGHLCVLLSDRTGSKSANPNRAGPDHQYGLRYDVAW